MQNRDDRYLFLTSTLFALLATSFCLGGGQETRSVNASNRPNFVLFIADDVSIDDIGCYGHPNIRTPNIDRLASDGLRFTNAYLVTSQCSPSRCSILSGRYPHNHGAPELHMPLPADQPMFTADLMKAGYWCVQAGKWHMGDEAMSSFDEVIATRDGGPGNERQWVPALQKRPRSQPFFAWFASTDAHRPWQPDPDGKPHTLKDPVIQPYLIDAEGTRDDLRQYYDEIQRFDRFIGLCLEELENQGVLSNTVIIVMADNGRPFPRCKTRLYDSGIKTPFIVWYPPLVQKAADCEALISTIDIAPTVLALAGLEPPPSVQGISFLPLLSDPTKRTRRFAFAEHNWHDFKAHERMVTDGRYLYIRNRLNQLPASQPGVAMAQGGAYQSLLAAFKKGALDEHQKDIFIEPRASEELYEIARDYHQLSNLAQIPSSAKKLEEMRQLLDQWIEQTGDTFPADLTEDTCDRYNSNALIVQSNGEKSIRPWRRGTPPGAERDAQHINHPGPR